MTPDFTEILRVAKERNALIFWVIFDRPSDHPNHFVVRPQLATKAGVEPWPESWLCDSLTLARSIIPPGLHRMERDPSDMPKIVESWV